MKNKSQKSFFNIGITSIVLIFVLLCLLTFSVLSLVSAKADYNLSQKSAQRTTDYYEAENEASDILHSIVDCLNTQAETADAEQFFVNVRSQLEEMDLVSFQDDRHLSYSVPLGDSQSLSVSLTISDIPYEDGNLYQIDSWKTVSSRQWNPDTSLPVLDADHMSDILKGE